MARDVKRFADLGYTAQRACAVDMFPRADHVEAVCLLTKERIAALTVPENRRGGMNEAL